MNEVEPLCWHMVIDAKKNDCQELISTVASLRGVSRPAVSAVVWSMLFSS